jgi:hypothetical protein
MSVKAPPAHLLLDDGTVLCAARADRLYVTIYEEDTTCLRCQWKLARRRKLRS